MHTSLPERLKRNAIHARIREQCDSIQRGSDTGETCASRRGDAILDRRCAVRELTDCEGEPRTARHGCADAHECDQSAMISIGAVRAKFVRKYGLNANAHWATC